MASNNYKMPVAKNVRRVRMAGERGNLTAVDMAKDGATSYHKKDLTGTELARATGEIGNMSEADKRKYGGTKAMIERLKKGK